jgi:hypothetical protein
MWRCALSSEGNSQHYLSGSKGKWQMDRMVGTEFEIELALATNARPSDPVQDG